MNRREAIRAVMALPGLSTIKRADLRHDDVIVAEIPGTVEDHDLFTLHTALQRIWPNHRIVLLTDGVQLKVVRGTEVAL